MWSTARLKKSKKGVPVQGKLRSAPNPVAPWEELNKKIQKKVGRPKESRDVDTCYFV